MAAAAQHGRVAAVGVIGVELVLNQARCPGQHRAAHSRLQRLEIEFLDGLPPQLRNQFLGNFTAKFGAERGFF